MFNERIDPDDIWLQAVINEKETRYLPRVLSTDEKDGGECIIKSSLIIQDRVE